MRVLVPFDSVIDAFETNGERYINEYMWKFYENGLRGAIDDWLISSRNLSYGGFLRGLQTPEHGLGDHLMLCYDTWVEKNPPIYGISNYEYSKTSSTLLLVGQLLEDSLNILVNRYLGRELKAMRIKSCRWVTDTAVIVEVDL